MHQRKFTALTILLALALAAFTVVPTLPRAQTAYAAAGIQLSRATAAPGDQIAVTGSGFAPQATATVAVDFTVKGNTQRVYTTAQVASDGTFKASFTVPDATDHGVYHVQAHDGHGNTAATSLTILPLIILPAGSTSHAAVNVRAGHSAYVGGTGFTAGETVTVTATFPQYSGHTASFSKTVTAGSDGTLAEFEIQVPADAKVGTVTLTAVGQQSGKKAQNTLNVVYRPQVTLSSKTVAAGGTVTMKGSGFVPNSRITISYTAQRSGAAATVVRNAFAGADGTFSTQIAVPADVRAATYTVSAVDSIANLKAAASLTVTLHPAIALKPSSVTPGQTLTVVGGGFGANVSVTVSATFALFGGGKRTVTAQVQTDGKGAFTTHLAVPKHAAAGKPTVTAKSANGRTATTQLQVGHVQARIAVTPSTISPGSTVAVRGFGYLAGSKVEVSLTVKLHNGTSTTLRSTATAGPAGQFRISVKIPANVSGGSYTLVAKSLASGRAPSAKLVVSKLTPSISLQPTALRPGQTLTVSGRGFGPNVSVTVSATFALFGGGKRTVTTTAQTNSSGAFGAHLAVPGQATAGRPTVTVRSAFGRTASAQLQVAAAPPSIVVSPATTSPGSAVAVQGSGYVTGSKIDITSTVKLHSGATTTLRTAATAGTGGRFSTSLKIPANVSGGSYTLVAKGLTSGRSSTAKLVVVKLAPSVVAVPTMAAPGTKVAASGFGFAASQQVTISLHGQKVGTATTNAAGKFTFTFTVPGSLATQTYTLTAVSAAGRTASINLMVQRAVSTHYYFAAEYTGRGYHEYLAMLNPTQIAARVTITYQLTNGTTRTKQFRLNAHTRFTEDVNSDLGFHVSAAAAVASDVPIAVSRLVYHKSDGAVVPGAKSPSTVWYFANGNTSHAYREFIGVQNPNHTAIRVALHLLPTHHRAFTVYRNMPPTSKTTFKVNSYVRDAVGVILTANAPVVANRTIFIHRGMNSKIGVTRPRTSWYFAAGPGNPSARNWIGAINATNHRTYVVLRAFGRYGQLLAVHKQWLRPFARVGYLMNRLAHQTNVAVTLQGSAPLVAEQTSYVGRHHKASTDAFGDVTPAKSWVFPVANTFSGKNDRLSLFNPNGTAVPIVVQFMTTSGAVTERTYVVGPMAHIAIDVNSVEPNQRVGLVAASNDPFVALNRYTFNRGAGAATSEGISQ